MLAASVNSCLASSLEKVHELPCVAGNRFCVTAGLETMTAAGFLAHDVIVASAIGRTVNGFSLRLKPLLRIIIGPPDPKWGYFTLYFVRTLEMMTGFFPGWLTVEACFTMPTPGAYQ